MQLAVHTHSVQCTLCVFLLLPFKEAMSEFEVCILDTMYLYLHLHL